MTRELSSNASADQGGLVPLVSIIIPTYNSGSLLDSTLSSCLKIKGVDVEILVIDDASTDGTPEHVRERYPSVTLYQLSKNSGSGAAGRNLGLSVAKGRYIKFLDHDDLLQPRGFKAECWEALRSDADMIVSRWGVVSIDDQGRFQNGDLRIYSPPEPSRVIEAILLGEIVPFTAATLYKSSYIQGEQWDAAAVTIDDFDWFCRMVARGGEIVKIDTISYYWRLHPFSIQGQSFSDGTLYEKSMAIRFGVYKKFEKQLEKTGQLSPSRKKLMAQAYYGFLRPFSRVDKQQCQAILDSIYGLDPEFSVDKSIEADSKVLWFVRKFGLVFFLLCYRQVGKLQRVSGGFRKPAVLLSRLLMRPAVQVLDRG